MTYVSTVLANKVTGASRYNWLVKIAGPNCKAMNFCVDAFYDVVYYSLPLLSQCDYGCKMIGSTYLTARQTLQGHFLKISLCRCCKRPIYDGVYYRN